MDPKDRLPAEFPPLEAEEMMRRLTAAGVDFVVIGGIALVLLGSPRMTRDLDIVFAPDDANLDALGRVLVELDARLREVDESVPFVPEGATLRNVQLLTLVTSAGWFDVHRSVDGAPPYRQLRDNAERCDLGEFSVLVASPDDMIAMKQAAGRPQDLIDVETLAAIKRLRRRLGRR
ncbi:MAG TPA: nucleotidyl transferase AbiEii/AbiGii toxin family protein [Solirubrobacterales bacterium]|nr:nucleotidyl transferase AbiEii/AbiGii toxin family protein [Solirubrobacterales bacterium]